VTDRTEQLIREAFAAEADRAPDPRSVLAGLARARPRRRHGMTLLAAGVAMVAVVAIALAAFVVPRALDRGAPAAGGGAAVDQTVLLAGLDRAKYTDALMLARVRADGSTAVVSLPRDSWVDVPGHGKQRLNRVYLDHGIATLVETVHRLTGVRPDHYALLDMAGFGELADVVGGVPVCLRAATTDHRTGVSFPAGEQTVSGDRALAFLRQRVGLPNGDLDRIARQQAFLRSLAGMLRARPDTVSAALEVVRDRASLDPKWDLLGLAAQLQGAGAGRARFATVPVAGEVVEPDGGSVLDLDAGAVRAFVTSAFGAGSGAGSGSATAEPGGGKSTPDCVN
jgi:LCP family protein required for cell wall assembly